ncbi:ModE family transcriptional regulator [Fulvitalea axinellae]|uniref:ModE family transcriptional regulator n=1 Tax=Fulvitalea axinellae TaxID=1182444 RepID=A0AAU9CRC3_9BACT|nr:ModE family transcriptional regulator [Fulvitalea axinellae]
MKYRIKSRVWIEVDDNVLLGEGRVRLIKEIEKTGSLSKGAKAMGMSYKKAWTLIDAINKSAKMPVISMSIGGKGGGGATLTDYGRELVATFDKINKSCWRHLDRQVTKIESL